MKQTNGKLTPDNKLWDGVRCGPSLQRTSSLNPLHTNGRLRANKNIRKNIKFRAHKQRERNKTLPKPIKDIANMRIEAKSGEFLAKILEQMKKIDG